MSGDSKKAGHSPGEQKARDEQAAEEQQAAGLAELGVLGPSHAPDDPPDQCHDTDNPANHGAKHAPAHEPRSSSDMSEGKVREIYVLLAEYGSPIGEGLCMLAGLGVPTPAVCTDLDQPGTTLKERLAHLRVYARQLARRDPSRGRIRIVRFTVREDVETFGKALD